MIAAAGLIAGLATLWLMRGGWFRWDAWDFLQYRSARTLRGLFAPHGGGLQWFTVVFYRALAKTIGFDYWPWYVLPWAIGYPLVVIGGWYLVVRRGAPRLTAAAGAIVLMFLGAAGYLYDGAIGQLGSMAAGMAAVVMLQSDRWNRGRLQLFGVLAFLTLTTADIGIAVYVGLVATALGFRRRIAVLVSLAPAGLFYAGWYLKARGQYNTATPDDLLTAPLGAYRILAVHLPRFLGWGWGWLVVALAVTGAVAALRRAPLRPWTVAWLSALLTYLILLWAVRIAPGRASVATLRYGLWPVVLVYLAVLPGLRRWPIRLDVSMATLLVVVGLYSNVPVWARQHRGDAADGALNRIRAEAAITLIDRGEPFHPRGRLEMDGGWAVPEGLRRMEREGWRPDLVTDPAELDAARIRIRTRMLAAPSPPAAACVDLADGETIVQQIEGRGRMIISPVTGDPTLRTDWSDRWGTSERTDRVRAPSELQYESGSGATVGWSVSGGSVSLCGPAGSGPGS